MPTLNHPVVEAVTFRQLPGGRLDLGTWPAHNIVPVEVPQLRRAKCAWNPRFAGRIQRCRPAGSHLLVAFALIGHAGLLDGSSPSTGRSRCG